MSFPRYPSYKDSGVAGLGDVPSHWEIKPLKHLAAIDSCGSYGVEAEEAEIALPVATTAQIDANGGFAVDRMPVRGFAPAEVQRFGCSDGDILVVKSSGSATNIISGKVGLVDEATPLFVFSNFLMRVRPAKELATPKFIYALLRSQLTRQRVEQMCSTTTYPNLQVGEYCSAPLPIPPLPEQTAIAAFLDGETAKIDELVAEQRRLMELLKEKRQAVISHAVTKGLNPRAPMKPSGIEWLGDVPAHWEARRISSLSTKITNGYVGPTRDILKDEGVRYLQSLHIKGNEIRFDTPYFVSEEWSLEHSKSILEAGDVLIVQTGDIGQSAVVPKEFVGCNCHALIIVAPVRSHVDGSWISWVLNSDYGFHTLLSIQTGALHPHLNCGDIKDVFIPLPPLAEQREIVSYIVEQVHRFDTLTAEAQRAIDLLQERRTALISAAVTGQIDVRGTRSVSLPN